MEETYRSQFRLPQHLYEKLKASAEASGRPLNTELVRRLEASFLSVDQPPTSATPEVFREFVYYHRAVTALTFLLQDVAELLDEKLPDDLRHDAEFTSLINSIEMAVVDVKRTMKITGNPI